MLEQLKIDEEFQSKIPPLTKDEFQQLEQNILEDGEVHTPIVVWNGTIVDGHNRWKILQKHSEIPYKVKQMDFADKWEAFDWMYKNQLGRRNLTEEQRDYLIGKRYEAQKNTQGGTGANQYTKMQTGQNVQSATRRESRDGTAGKIGKEYGITDRSVRRNEQYAKGIDTIREIEPKVADSILTGQTSVPKKDIRDIRNAKENDIKSFVKAIKDGTVRHKPKVMSEEDKKDMKDIKKYVEESRTASNYVPEVQDLIRDLKNNSAPYIRLLNQMITCYKSVIKGNGEIVLEAIKESIEDEIEKIKEKITNEYA